MEPRRRFKFLKELASGGFGKVYLAEMVTGEGFSSAVAIKLLHARWVNNHEIVSRSRDEARLLGRLRHANIVRVEDLTSITGQCAIVMEYLNGVDLRSVCGWLREQDKPFPRQAAFEVIAGVASALDAAYNSTPPQGGEPLRVIHRDIKPSNVMITVEGDVKVLDFGTARATFAEREATTEALAFGSTAFMSPERHMGDDDTPSADIFSLGITTYEMLTCQGYGKIQIRREKFEETLDERLAEIDLGAVPAELRVEVLTTLRGMLAYEHPDRPTAAEVVERMERFAEQTRDGGVKRFAREIVRPLASQPSADPDPNDPLTGNEVYEDTGPPAPRTTRAGTEPPPRAPNETAPYPVDEGPEPVESAPRPRPRPEPDPFEDPPPRRSSTGLILKVAAGLTALALLAAMTAGGLWYAVIRDSAAAVDVPTPTPVVPPSEVRGGLPTGTLEADWRPNDAGRGGALLRAPVGAADVSITSTDGYKAEWDGAGWFRIRNVLPGVYRTKAIPGPRAASIRGDFTIEAGRTCVWSLGADGAWTRGECR